MVSPLLSSLLLLPPTYRQGKGGPCDVNKTAKNVYCGGSRRPDVSVCKCLGKRGFLHTNVSAVIHSYAAEQKNVRYIYTFDEKVPTSDNGEAIGYASGLLSRSQRVLTM